MINWYSVGLGAASGGLAALAAALVLGKRRANGILFTIFMGTFFLLFNAVSLRYILPELDALNARSDIETAFAAIPAFQSIKKHEPDTYETMVTSLTEAVKRNYSQQQVIDLIRGQASSIVARRLPKASDEAIRNYIDVVVDEIAELQSQGGDLCFRLLFPQAGAGIDARQVFSSELLQRDLAALDSVISSYDAARHIPYEDEVLPLLNPIYTELFAEFGDDVRDLNAPMAEGVDKDRLCTITKSLYLKILALDSAQASKALRWMFFQM